MPVGIKIECTVCGYEKKPLGRDQPLGTHYCTPIIFGLPGGCQGYYRDPQAITLWPGEVQKEGE